MKPTIHELVKDFREAHDALLERAREGPPYEFLPSDCPLAEGHYIFSEMIFGCGCWSWTCGFCGAEFEE